MKIYFKHKDSEMCHSKKYFDQYMKENNIIEMKVYRAEIEYRTDYFFCRIFQSLGIKGEYCGVECEEYKPRNGKNGRCCYSSNCYTATNDEIIKIK